METVKLNFAAYAYAVVKQNATLRGEALAALSAAGIEITDRASIIRRQIPERAMSYFTALAEAISQGDARAVTKATDRLLSCGLSVKVKPSLIDSKALAAGR